MNDGAGDQATRAQPDESAAPAADTMLREPLLRHLVIANGVILAVCVAAVGLAVPRVATPPGPVVVVLGAIVVGLASSFVTSARIIRKFLIPLRTLERDAARIGTADEVEVTASATYGLDRFVGSIRGALVVAQNRNRQLREMAVRSHAGSEEEKRRLSIDLHDGIAQSLAALNIQVKLARGAASEQVRESVLDEVSAGLSGAILEVRRIARSLRPTALEVLGLAASIETHARSTATMAGLATEIRAEKVSGLLSPDVELALYRMLQESLTNVVKHASANQLRVDLARRDGDVRLVVEDDGRGFDPDEVNGQNRGLGLFGMRERIESLGGRFEIASRTGRGTRVCAAFPVLEGANG